MDKERMSCIDCMVKNCNHEDKTFPDFCLTTNMDEEVLKNAMDCYREEENKKVMVSAAEVEYDYYCQQTRVEEIMSFAEKIGAKKIGIATCVGHDSLFYKYSEALTTTAVTKDRVLGHNPVAALYTADGYYSKLMK